MVSGGLLFVAGSVFAGSAWASFEEGGMEVSLLVTAGCELLESGTTGADATAGTDSPFARADWFLSTFKKPTIMDCPALNSSDERLFHFFKLDKGTLL